MDQFKSFCREHKWTTILVVLGVVFAILFMTIGFWRTLLLLLMVGVCFVIGYVMDQNGVEGVKALFRQVFQGKKKV